MGENNRMWIGTLIIFIMIIAMFPFIYAQEVYTIELSINAVNIDGFNSKFFIYDFNTQNITSGNQVIGPNNLLKFSLNEGFYELSIGVDDPSTPGFDYYGKVSLNADANKRVEIDAVHVGSRKIEIIDKNGARLKGVPLRIDCNSLSGQQGYFRTDDFGIAEANFLPIGECVFRAAAGDFIIIHNETIDKGSADGILMKFDDYSRNSSNYIWVFGIIFVILLFVYYYLYKKSNDKKNLDRRQMIKGRIVPDGIDDRAVNHINHVDDYSKDKTAEEKGSLNIKKDIMTALTPNERKVVRFILEAQNEYESKNGTTNGFYLHQAKIVYGAGIPKTTLVRLLQSLEQKKIIEWEKSGKIKKIRLTEWFASK